MFAWSVDVIISVSWHWLQKPIIVAALTKAIVSKLPLTYAFDEIRTLVEYVVEIAVIYICINRSYLIAGHETYIFIRFI